MQQVEELAPHVQEIARALENRVELEQIEDELRRYVEYGVPLAQAKRDIVRNHGGTLRAGRKKLNELAAGDSGIEFVAKVLTVNPKEVTIKGEPKEIWYGFLADETAKIPYTAWKDHGLERGTTIHVANAYAKQGFREGIEINLGDYARVQRAEEELENVVDSMPGSPENQAAGGGRSGTPKTIRELADGLNSVEVTGRVLQSHEKVINGANGERRLVEGQLADATGKVQFTAWAPDAHAELLAEGNVVRIKNAYVKAWRGVPNLNFGENASVEKLASDTLPPASELAKENLVTIGELAKVGGATGVAVEGVVLEVKKGSGLIFRCTQCNRVLQKRECRVHGKNEGTADLRVKAVIDDGTGALTFFTNKETTEKLLGKTLEQAQKMAMEAMSVDVIQDELTQQLTARQLRVGGNVTSDDFGLQMIATDARFPDPVDAQAAAEALLNELSELFPEVA